MLHHLRDGPESFSQRKAGACRAEEMSTKWPDDKGLLDRSEARLPLGRSATPARPQT